MGSSLTRSHLLVALVLVAVTTIVFGQVVGHGFVNYDDDKYVIENGRVLDGLSVQGIVWAFTATHGANWHPLTWLSHMLDAQLYGAKPWGHHLTSLILHVANTVLLFLVLHRMTGSVWKSGFVAALFGVHPLHVESVAWIAERKDVLSTLFWLLTMWAYVRYAEFKVQSSRFKVGAYLSVIVLFSLGLMAKPMLVTLPFVLLLLDYWPLGRFRGGPHPNPLPLRGCTGEGESGKVVFRGCTGEGVRTPSPVRESVNGTGEGRGEGSGLPVTRCSSLVMEKVPLLALSILSSVITFIAQKQGGAVTTIQQFPLGIRLTNAIVSYLAYIAKMVFPRRLAVFYAHPGPSLPVWQVIVSGVLILAVSVIVIRAARSRPYLGVGWLWYLGTLVPVIGIVQVGAQSMADRYTYVPLIGLFVMVAWGIPELLKGRIQSPHPPISHQPSAISHSPILPFSASVALLALGMCAYIQVGYWRGSVALFTHAVVATRNNYLAHNNLGFALANQGETEQAIRHYNRALEIKPDFGLAHNNLGLALAELGRHEEAIEHYRLAFEEDPDSPAVHNNLAIALIGLGRLDEAIEHLTEALRLQPDYAEAHANMGIALFHKGDLDGAIAHYREALRYKPGHAATHSNLGAAYARGGDLDRAVAEYEEALSLDPESADAHSNLGLTYSLQGKWDDAIREYREALRIQPGLVQARRSLAVAFASVGDFAGAWDEINWCRRNGVPVDPAFLGALSREMPDPGVGG